MKEIRKKANHQDTKGTKRHQEVQKHSLVFLGDPWCPWCLGGSQFCFTGAGA
jgi:hypothetical protein